MIRCQSFQNIDFFEFTAYIWAGSLIKSWLGLSALHSSKISSFSRRIRTRSWRKFTKFQYTCFEYSPPKNLRNVRNIGYFRKGKPFINICTHSPSFPGIFESFLYGFNPFWLSLRQVSGLRWESGHQFVFGTVHPSPCLTGWFGYQKSENLSSLNILTPALKLLSFWRNFYSQVCSIASRRGG